MKKIPFLSCLFGISFTAISPAVNVLTENFNYPDGAVGTVSGGIWTNHSGTVGQVNVLSSAIELTSAESEDVSARLAAPGLRYNAGIMTAEVDVNFSALPAGTGAYFFHFRDFTTGFRGRVWATVTDAVAGSYRLGISNSTAVFNAIATDFALGTTQKLLVTLDVVTGISSLSINGGAATTAADASTPILVESIAFRQSLATGNGMGTLTADNLRVDASAVPVPEPSTGLFGLLALGLLRRRR